MDTCPIPRLLEKQEQLDLHNIVLFFNKYYPDEYISHIIENRGEHQYERIKLGQWRFSLPRVIIHKPTKEDFAIVVSPSSKIEFHKPYAKIYLGKKISILFFEVQESDGKMKHYVELHDDSMIVRIVPTGFVVFSANYCRAFTDCQE